MEIGDLEVFVDALKAKFALPGAASPEDQLKPGPKRICPNTRFGLTLRFMSGA